VIHFDWHQAVSHLGLPKGKTILLRYPAQWKSNICDDESRAIPQEL